MQKLNRRMLIGAGTGLTIGLAGLLAVGPALADTTAPKQVAPTEWSQVLNPYGFGVAADYNVYPDYVGPANGPLQPNTTIDWRDSNNETALPVVDLSWRAPAPADNCVRLINGFTISLTANEPIGPGPDITVDSLPTAPGVDLLTAPPSDVPATAPATPDQGTPTATKTPAATETSSETQTPAAPEETGAPTSSAASSAPPAEPQSPAPAETTTPTKVETLDAPAAAAEPTPDPTLSYAQAAVGFSTDNQATMYPDDTVSGVFNAPVGPGLNVLYIPVNTPSSFTVALNEPLEYTADMSAIIAVASFANYEQTWTINQVRFNVTDTCADAPGTQTTEPVVTAVSTSGGATLASTGSEQTGFLLGGVALVIAGGAMLLGLRRRGTEI